MTLRAILDIDVRDEAFNKFQANFKIYQELLAKQPAEWEQVKKSVDGSAKSFQVLVTASLARQAQSRAIATAEGEAARQLDRQTHSWRDMARSTKEVAGNILGATKSLLRWSGFIGTVSGLLGAGGLYGIDRLAQSAGGMRRSSMGLGVSPGQQRSFGVNYGRLVDTDSFLSAVNTGQHDVGSQQFVGLMGAGLSQKDIQGKNTATLSMDLIDHLKTIVDQTDPRLLGPTLRARHLDQFLPSVQIAEQLRATSRGEIAGWRRDAGRDVGSLNLDPKTQSAWQNLQVQLDRAGKQIETTFINGLVGLTPGLEHLSRSFQELVSAFIKSPEVKGWIDELGHGMDWLGKELGTPEFHESITSFVAGMGRLAKAVAWLVGWLLDDDKKPNDGLTGDMSGTDRYGGNPSLGPTTTVTKMNELLEWFKQHLPDYSGGATLSPMGYTGTPLFGQARVWQTMYQPMGGSPGGLGSPRPGSDDPARGNPANGDTLSLIEHYESGGRNVPNYRFDPTHTAQGYFQITNSTWREIAPKVGAGQYSNAMSAPYDVQKEVAKELLRERGTQPWSTNVPLMNRLNNGGGGTFNTNRPNVTIRIDNNTGGNAHVSAAALQT